MKNFLTGRKVFIFSIAGTLLIFIGFIIGVGSNSTKPTDQKQNVAGEKTQIPQAESPSPSASQILEGTIAKGPEAQVTKVVDGDTVTVSTNGKSETIRIIGINTPETVDPRKSVECFGVQASEHAKELLRGKTVRLEADPTQGERDKYQRLLRYIWINETTDFGSSMIKDGFAYEYTYSTPYKYQVDYKNLQTEAERSKKGLWADNACATQSTNPTNTTNTSPSSVASSGDKDCSDFKTHQEAQSYFISKGGSPTNNVDRLDSDHDGIACESLP